MSRIGLVLGGGGITGASFHFGALFGLRLATGWDPSESDVVVGTSSGAMVAALLRSGSLDVAALVGDVHGSDELAQELRERIFRRTRPKGIGRWMRHGLLPGLRRPGIELTLGSPAPYTTEGIADWTRELIGRAADAWPDRPTTIVSYELETRRRVAFGTVGSPDVDLATAVAASSAVPLVFEPVAIGGKRYVDGGIASGTNADLVLGSAEQLDLLLVLAPMASIEARTDARFYESVVDRLGGAALDAELEAVSAAWPNTDVLVLRPDADVLAWSRPNPLDLNAALPTFLATLRSMQTTLADHDVWTVLTKHMGRTRRRLPWGRRLKLRSR